MNTRAFFITKTPYPVKITAVCLLTAVFVLFLLPLERVSAAPEDMMEVLLGDVNNDGAVSSADARFTLRLSVGLETLMPEAIPICDVDLDGKASAGDARLILRKSVGLDSYASQTVSVPFGVFENDDPYAGKDTSIFNVPPPEAPVIDAPSGTFTFVTYGWGHGVGLSQYGAQIMARAGFTYREILEYYFSGCITVRDENIPETTVYEGTEIDTYELVCRITMQEIGGITGGLPEAMKAQAVAVYTLLKREGFSVSSAGNVGYAKKSMDDCSDECKEAVEAVLGEYETRQFDQTLSPVLTVYSAMCAGSSVGCYEIWYDSYPAPVSSPFEMGLDNFISVSTYTVGQVRDAILAYLPDTVLSEDPAEWIEIVTHNHSIDEDRGYVTQIMVGDTLLSKVEAFNRVIPLCSGCFTVTYTP